MTYTVDTRAVKRTIRRLAPDMQRRVLRALAALETNPRPPQSRKLAGHENLWRLRVGDWRIIYTIEDERLIVIIVGVGHRGDVYRRM